MTRSFYTVKEVAGALAVSVATAHRLLDAGEIPSTYCGKLRRVPKVDFDSYVEAITEDARAQQSERRTAPHRARIYRTA